MQLGKRTTRTTLIGVAALALGAAGIAALSGAAHAEPEPADGAHPARPAAVAFLEPDDLPSGAGEWTADPVADGLPETDPTCLAGVLPEDGAQHRTFRTDLDAQATQVVVASADAAAARDLLARTEDALRECADAYAEQYPDATFTGEDLGAVDAGDGAHVYGLQSAFPHGSLDAHLFGVGRDGAAVTVTVLGQLGRLSDAPVADFTDSTRTSVTRLAG